MASRQLCYSGSVIACSSLILTFKQLYLIIPQSGKVTPATCTICFLLRDYVPQRKGVLARLYIITEPRRLRKEIGFNQLGRYGFAVWKSELPGQFIDSEYYDNQL